jgi:hypothetical protein
MPHQAYGVNILIDSACCDGGRTGKRFDREPVRFEIGEPHGLMQPKSQFVAGQAQLNWFRDPLPPWLAHRDPPAFQFFMK